MDNRTAPRSLRVGGVNSIAKRIIELAKAGERDPDALCDQALSYFLRDPTMSVTRHRAQRAARQ